MTDSARESSSLNKWWFASLGLILLIIAGTAIQLATNRKQEQPQAAPPAPTAVSNGSAGTPPSTSAKGCISTPTATGGALTHAPQTLSWDDVEGMAVPRTVNGPFVQEGAVARCYTPDTRGAVAAASNIMLRLFASSGVEVLKAQVTPQPSESDIKIFLQNRTQPPYPQIEGFRTEGGIVGNQVTVYIKLRVPGSNGVQHSGAPFRMVWTGDDWKAIGQDISNDQSNLSQYIPWGRS